MMEHLRELRVEVYVNTNKQSDTQSVLLGEEQTLDEFKAAVSGLIDSMLPKED